MTPEQLELERQAFEAYYNELKGFGSLERVGDTYAYSHPDYAWQSWLARAQQSAWISVKDKLPENNACYLGAYEVPFADGLGTGICYFDAKDRVFRTNPNGIIITIVTHWQPLPEPPKAA